MKRIFAASLTALVASTLAARAEDDVAQFYTGRQVRIVVGIAVGSGYDLTARILARHLADHIPGKPSIIVQNQPGAGSLTMTHALYNSGPKDGTAIGASFQGMAFAPIFTPDLARFDATKLNWVGSTNRETQVTYAWATVPIRTIADIKARKFVVGSQAPGSSQNDFPVALDRMFGYQFNVVNGYESTSKIHLAMERGEVEGIAAVNWSSVTALVPQWITEKKITIIGQFANRRHKDLPDVPMWSDVVSAPADRQAMELLLSRLEFGRPYFLPPDVPAARVEAMRRAFDATMKDPAFLAEADKAKLEIDPVTGQELANLVAKANATPPAIIARVRDALAVK